MADKAQAWNAFWNSFLLPAYDQNTVPSSAPLPYITYEYSESDFDRPVMLMASLWYRDSSWAAITQKSKEIFDFIGFGGTILHYDGGAMWLKRGSPFSQRMDEPNDFSVRRILLNVELEDLT